MSNDRNHPPGSAPAKKKRRKRCVNHPRTPAVARCEICGKPICRECIAHYEGARICSETCWKRKVYEEKKRIEAEERLRRKKKEEMANRATTIGLWCVVILVVGAVGAFIYTRVSDRSGQKLWELSDPSEFGYHCVHEQSDTVCLALSDGTIRMLDGRTGEKKWSVRLPEGSGGVRARMIDEHRCLVYRGNTVFLCSSTRAEPVWELSVSRHALSATPTMHGDTLLGI